MYNSIREFGFALVAMACLSSCYTYTASMGQGAQGAKTAQAKNHYVLFGLAPVGDQKSPEQLTGGVKDYKVTHQHTFVDGLLGVLTWGLYHPTTIKVTY